MPYLRLLGRKGRPSSRHFQIGRIRPVSGWPRQKRPPCKFFRIWKKPTSNSSPRQGGSSAKATIRPLNKKRVREQVRWKGLESRIHAVPCGIRGLAKSGTCRGHFALEPDVRTESIPAITITVDGIVLPKLLSGFQSHCLQVGFCTGPRPILPPSNVAMSDWVVMDIVHRGKKMSFRFLPGLR